MKDVPAAASRSKLECSTATRNRLRPFRTLRERNVPLLPGVSLLGKHAGERRVRLEEPVARVKQRVHFGTATVHLDPVGSDASKSRSRRSWME
jgi:hypothetical protein